MPDSSEVTAEWLTTAVDVGDLVLHVHRAGRSDRPPVVLVHGLGDSGRCWWRVADALADDFDLVMIDARNHGRSGTGAGDAKQVADDVAAVIAQLDLDRPMLLGHSVGAQTVANLAASGGTASRLVLVDPPWTADQEADATMSDERRAAVRSWLASCAAASNDELAAIVRAQHPNWPAEEYPTWIESKGQVRLEAVDSLGGRGWGATVAAIDCPTLLVHGGADGDGIVTAAVAARVGELNPQVRTMSIAGAGHNIHREQFDRFLEATRPFLLTPEHASHQPFVWDSP